MNCDMRNRQLTRTLELLLLATSRAYSLPELAAQCGGVSTRTIRRDLEALESAGFAVTNLANGNEPGLWRIETSHFAERLRRAAIGAPSITRADIGRGHVVDHVFKEESPRP